MEPNIGGNIRKLRIEKQVTQEQLADYLSISSQAVSKWENGVTTPDIYLLPRIAEFFGTSIDEIFKTDMKGYRHKAERLLYQYGMDSLTLTKENFDKADAEYEKLFNGCKADGNDMYEYGHLNECRSYVLAKKAEKLFNQAIESGNEKAEHQLVYLMNSTGRWKDNVDRYEKALEKNPDNSRNWYFLAYSYAGSETTFNKSLEIAEEGLRRFPNDRFLLNNCAMVCRALGRYDEAVGYCNLGIKNYPDMIDNYYELAFVYTDMEEYGNAVKAWEQVIVLLKEQALNDEVFEIQSEWPKREIAKLRLLAGL